MIWCELKGTNVEDIVKIPLKYKKYISLNKEYWFIDYTYKPKIKKIMIAGISAAYDLCAERYELQYEILRKKFFLGWKEDGSYSCGYILNNIFDTKEEAKNKLKMFINENKKALQTLRNGTYTSFDLENKN